MQYGKQQQYLKVQVETASPGELTLLLYQEMVKSLLLAKQLFSQNQFEAMNTPLHKVRAIFSELIITLNHEYEIARNLHQLYEFYSQHVAKFIINKDELLLDDTLEFAKGLLETWKVALGSLKKSNEVQNYV